MPTKIIDSIKFYDNTITSHKIEDKNIDNINDIIDKLSLGFSKFNQIFYYFDKLFINNNWIIMENKPVVYIHKIAAIIPNLDIEEISSSSTDTNYVLNKNLLIFSGFHGTLPSRNEAISCFNNKSPYHTDSGYIKANTYFYYHGITFEENGEYLYRYTLKNFYGIDGKYGETHRH